MRRFDVAVLGGGPAGATAARRLANLGHTVALFHRALPATTGPRWESLSPGAAELVVHHHAEFGPRALAGALRGRGRVRWARDDQPSGHASTVLARDSLDLALRASAAAAGVVIHPGNARALRLREPATIDADAPRWRLSLDDEPGAAIACRLVIDASGRPSPAAGRSTVVGAPLYALQTRLATRRIRPGDTQLEALPDGWLWSVGLAGGEALVLVFVDPETLQRLGRDRLAPHIESALRHTTTFGGTGWQRLTPFTVRDAAARLAAETFAPDLLCAGDAAFASDPLSSQGLQYALNHASQAAVLAHTLLTHPERTSLVAQFHAQRLTETVNRHRTHTAQLYARQNLFASSFWSQRGTASPEISTAAPSPIVADAIRLDAPLTLDPAAAWRSEPALVGDLIAETPVLHHPTLATPIAFVGQASAHKLLAPLVEPMTGAALLETWQTRRLLSSSAAARLLGDLVQRGIVRAARTSSSLRPSELTAL